MLANFRSCLYDCSRAIKFNPSNIKAYYRSCKALLSLDRVDEGLDCCVQGSILDPNLFISYQVQFEKRKLNLEAQEALEKKKSDEKKAISDKLEQIISQK